MAKGGRNLPRRAEDAEEVLQPDSRMPNLYEAVLAGCPYSLGRFGAGQSGPAGDRLRMKVVNKARWQDKDTR